MLKHPAECGLVVHTQTHSAGCHDTHAVSLSSVKDIYFTNPKANTDENRWEKI